MYTLKGFIHAVALENNAIDTVSKIGELSTYARTYSREQGTYSSDTYPDVNLVSFYSTNTSGNPAVTTEVSVPSNMVQPILAISQWVYGQAIGGGATSSQQDFLQSLIAEFEGLYDDLQTGSMVSENGMFMPEWISFSSVEFGADNYVKLWFSDPAFRGQYDQYHIAVIPAFSNVDDFFDTLTNVQTKLEARPLSTMIGEAQAAANNKPYTILRTETYEWVNPSNIVQLLETNWLVMIWGIGGNNIDNIKRAIIDYILANSSHPRSEWDELLPGLFKNTEFIIAPFWNEYSVPNQDLKAGLYSPVMEYTKILPHIKQATTTYLDPHVESNLEVAVANYKCIGFATVGGPDNREGQFKFSTVWPMFNILASTHIDFERLSPDTQAFILLLQNMFKVSEEMTETSTIPIEMTRAKRGDLVFLSASFNEIQYLMVSKKSYEALNAGG